MTNFMFNILPEIFYMLCGLVCFDASWRAYTKNTEAKYGTAIFWLLVGVIFFAGKVLPSAAVGAILVAMGLLTVTNQVKMGKFEEVSVEERTKESKLKGNKIFIPAVAVGLSVMLLSFVRIDGAPLNGAASVGIACLIAFILAVIICHPKAGETRENTTKQLMQVGASCLLPQLLGALGAVFTEAGVGEVISSMISSVVPSGNPVIGVIIYCLGMVIFTMIMGNAFAAFSVITIGIGIPFVIAQGANPAIVGALGMTCGFCGTLLTPMAANFNIVPVAVLEAKSKWTVIKAQAPMAVALFITHVILMLVLAF